MARSPLLPADPYLALAVSIEAYLNAYDGELDPWMIRKIALELGFTHPIEGTLAPTTQQS